MAIKTIFLDRDGVINKDKNYLYKIDDFEFIDGVFNSCKYLQNLGFKIIIVTNQSGIHRDFYTEEDFENLTNWMLCKFTDNNIEILDVFHCPHGPNSNCYCRKPKPGMLLSAKEKYNINMEDSWMIGDKEHDIMAANNAGIMNTVLVKSGHTVDLSKSNASHFLKSIDDINQVIR